ncbi:hypothetical protein [Lignipirellula cremea]|uniref:Uncharacterized protein n=1 Tax=Lignipirellula cremea TaxID=2528010 RepID=A0A518DYC6_9BACT|nr:hypothetical protein [Lignipirellula cremea]QDU96850.1 hypothetical protein Pla8534_46720 [Lignipirellula cremea]
MAKKKSPTTQAVLDFLDANPDATAKTVVPALAEQGVTVSQSQVNTIRSVLKKKQGVKVRVKRKKAAAAVAPAPSAAKPGRGDAITAAELREAKALVDKLGGFSAAKEAIASLESLQ